MNKINNQISFQSYKSNFSKKLEKAIKTGENSGIIAKDFRSVFERKANDKYMIGYGAYGMVFRIDDYYVFKLMIPFLNS